jgi:segregation and condensation protein A
VTVTQTTEQSTIEFNLEELVKNATWRELLVELVEKERIDPWAIDLARIVDSYLTVVKQMRVLDLHVPANIMLAASILLRLKSESLSIFEVPQEAAEEQIQTERVIPAVEALVPRSRMQPGRRITLQELMDVLNDAMKITEKRAIAVTEHSVPLTFPVVKEDIDAKISAAYMLIKSNADKEGMVCFSQVSKRFDSLTSVLIDFFIPILFLAHRKSVALMQETFFDDILIKLTGDVHGGPD